MILLGTLPLGAMTIGLGLFTNFIPYLACMALIGVSVPITNTPFMTILQTKADDEYMGRVFSVLTMLSSIAMPLAMLIFGPLGDVVAIDWLLIVTGAIMIVVCPFFFVDKEIRAALAEPEDGRR
jgi:DHA3 family macrolide efflux protein-like MFS transporter